MATRVDLDKETIKLTLTLSINSLKRALNTAKNPKFKPIIEQDIANLNNAINTLTDIK